MPPAFQEEMSSVPVTSFQPSPQFTVVSENWHVKEIFNVTPSSEFSCLNVRLMLLEEPAPRNARRFWTKPSKPPLEVSSQTVPVPLGMINCAPTWRTICLEFVWRTPPESPFPHRTTPSQMLQEETILPTHLSAILLLSSPLFLYTCSLCSSSKFFWISSFKLPKKLNFLPSDSESFALWYDIKLKKLLIYL